MARLLYITNARIPTEKAHGLQIIKMCEAFQRQGCQVDLIVPFRVQSPAMKHVSNLWDYYQVATPFRIRHLWTPDVVWLTHRLPERLLMLLYYAQCLLFSVVALMLTLLTAQGIYYSRDLQTIFVLCLTKWLHRKPVFFEAHELHGTPDGKNLRSRLMRWMVQHLDGLVVITRRLQTLYAQMGVQPEQILVAPDGIDRQRLTYHSDKAAARRKLQIPLDRNVVCYTGHLFKWKGVYALAESVRYLPPDVLVYIVGGMAADVTALQQFVAVRGGANIRVTGYVPYANVPEYLAAADVLVLPNSAAEKISQEYTSPLKLFEYMAAQRPIVASDLPSLREMLRHQENAYLVTPDDPRALAEGVMVVMKDLTLTQAIVRKAFQDVQAHTWDARAQATLEFIAALNAGGVKNV